MRSSVELNGNDRGTTFQDPLTVDPERVDAVGCWAETGVTLTAIYLSSGRMLLVTDPYEAVLHKFGFSRTKKVKG